MKRSELTNKQKLLVPCPICTAAIGVPCKMYSGFGRRNEPHSERKYSAIQAIEHDDVSELFHESLRIHRERDVVRSSQI
jgi:hypothetical protein